MQCLVVVACLVLIGVGVLWAVPVSETRLVLSVEAEAMTLTLDEAASISGLRFRLAGDAAVTVQIAGQVTRPPWPGTLPLPVVIAGRVELTRLFLPDESRVQLRRLGGESLALYLPAGGAVEVATTGADGRFHAGPGETAWSDLADPQGFRIESVDQPLGVFLEGVGPNETLLPRELKVREMRFSVPDQHATEMQYRSTILGGRLRLPEVERAQELQPAEPLRLEDFRGKLVRLVSTEHGLRADFVGSARTITIGPEDYAEELTPSQLGWLAGRRNAGAAATIVGAFLALLATLWAAVLQRQPAASPRAGPP